MSRNRSTPLYLAVFASGRGSNLQSIIDAIENKTLNARIRVVLSNNSKSGALQRARKHDIPAVHLSHRMFKTEEEFEDIREHTEEVVEKDEVEGYGDSHSFISLKTAERRTPPWVSLAKCVLSMPTPSGIAVCFGRMFGGARTPPNANH